MSIKTDAIIIGAGVIGLSIGYNLSKKNIKTIILESENNIGDGKFFKKYRSHSCWYLL